MNKRNERHHIVNITYVKLSTDVCTFISNSAIVLFLFLFFAIFSVFFFLFFLCTLRYVIHSGQEWMTNKLKLCGISINQVGYLHFTSKSVMFIERNMEKQEKGKSIILFVCTFAELISASSILWIPIVRQQLIVFRHFTLSNVKTFLNLNTFVSIFFSFAVLIAN